ncbi:histidine kinase dimerization/phosphoacceptor domain -containing protein [Pedobacter sp. FW305-3-2-15-E-R2A2]|uniref:histidine kinase dimerization/phosphoacceptor domain -containing protein n=1 Tax=Pedobacter sp. FW305-3-2-15-E-R2A2 TaxID=3140251 RepID=UPI0031401F63
MSKTILLVFMTISLLFLKPTTAHSQGEIPIFRKQLAQAKTDIIRCSLQFSLAKTYYRTKGKKNLDSAAHFSRTVYQTLAKETQSSVALKSENLILLGQICIAQNKLSEGKSYFMQAISNYQKTGHADKEAESWLNLGLAIYNYDHLNQMNPEIRNYYEHALHIYQKRRHLQKEFELELKLTDLLFIEGKYEEADRKGLNLITSYRDKNIPGISELYYLMASISRYEGNYNKSLQYALEAIKFIKDESTDKNASAYYGELGLIYQELGNTEKSIEWYRKCLALREKMAISQVYIFRTAGFIAQQQILQGKPQEALNEIIAVEKRNPAKGNFEQAILYQIKGYCYEAMKNYTTAEKCYLKMIRLFEKETSDEIVSMAKYDIGKFYVGRKQYQKASGYLNGLIQKNYLISQKKELHFLQFKIDSAAGRYLAAMHQMNRYNALKDSIFSTVKSRQIEEIQIRYETEKKEQALSLLRKESLLRDQEVRNTRNLTIIGLVVLVCFIGFLYRNYRIIGHNNIEIQRKNKSLGELVKEKEWLIKEIHHRVKNNLQIVMGLLHRQSTYIENEKALDAIRNSEHRMQSISMIHQKLYNTDNLTVIRINEYVNDMTSYLRDCFGLHNRIQFIKDIAQVDLDISQAVPLGLILNEAITNAIKYAFKNNEEGNIHISFLPAGESLHQLIISDDGAGLPPGFDTSQVNSMGMNLMKGLSRQLGGTFSINSENGVRVTVIFKVDPAERYLPKIENYDLPLH